MPFQTGIILVAIGLVVVFATFFWLLVNARALMMLFRGGDSEIVAGPGSPRKTPSKSAALAMLVVHFAAWALAGTAWLWMQADVRATAADTTPLEAAKNSSR